MISPPPPIGTTTTSLRDVLHELEADRALAGDQRAVEGVHERTARVIDQLGEAVEGLRPDAASRSTSAPYAPCRRDLLLARAHHITSSASRPSARPQ